MQSHTRHILGIDPGLNRTGWGLVRTEGSRLSFVGCGTLKVKNEGSLSERLHRLHQLLDEVLTVYTIDEVAMEETFSNVNAASTLKLGQARGALLLTCARAGFVVSEYAARLVKQSVTGSGAAEKGQVAAMVAVLLPGSITHESDAADALAVAICHAHHAGLKSRLPAL